MTTRLLTVDDAPHALSLYRHLVGEQPLASDAAFTEVINHPGTSVWGAFLSDHMVAMATLHVLPNMTQGGRPYALVENVVTHEMHRGTGQGRRVMKAVIDAAWAADCYKIMLLTGRTAEARGFYEKLGFGADEKWGMTRRRVPLR
ncbi:GNAT family N-acetyltransferase [uncultured Tateyamaria sp.]|uniref:GNAT family N-acetyltransferase n=1 Tax=uncultured Tateyamaria sp. TaxID=455651 RepID=UPI002631CB3D|nr:GNAT family N-acetyltransferase [uncultured Tateyamaria sp.]